MVKKKDEDKPTAAAAPSPCEALKDQEIDIHLEIPVRTTDQLEWTLLYCNTPIDVKLYWKDRASGVRNLLLAEHNPPSPKISRLVPIPEISGRYLLEWDFIVTGQWQVVAEIRVNGVAAYRKYKAHDSTHPRTWGLVDLRVMA